MKFSKANEDAQMYTIQFTSHFPKNGERLGWIVDGIKATTNIPTRRVSTYRENSKAFPLTTHHRKFLFYLISLNSILDIFPDIIFFSDIFLLKKPKLNLFQDLNQLLHALRYFRLIVLILPEPGSRRGGGRGADPPGPSPESDLAILYRRARISLFNWLTFF